MHRLLVVECIEHGPGRDEKVCDPGKPLPLRGDRVERDRTDAKQYRTVICLQQRRKPICIAVVGRSPVDPPKGSTAA